MGKVCVSGKDMRRFPIILLGKYYGCNKAGMR